MLSLQKRSLQGDLIEAHKLIGAYKKDGDKHFTRDCSDRKRGSGFKLIEG